MWAVSSYQPKIYQLSLQPQVYKYKQDINKKCLFSKDFA